MVGALAKFGFPDSSAGATITASSGDFVCCEVTKSPEVPKRNRD
jgi:hypothetical protein